MSLVCIDRGLETKDDELKTVSENVKLLQEEMNTMQSTYVTYFLNVDGLESILNLNTRLIKISSICF